MIFILGVFLGVAIGWSWAHEEVKTECLRQGRFYVGRYDFKCTWTRREKSSPPEVEL